MQPPGVTIHNRSPRLGRKEIHSTTINLTPSAAYATTTATTTTAGMGGRAGVGAGAEYRSNSPRPMREALVLGVSFFFVYTSFHAIQNLQSSLHEEGGLGLAALATNYGASFFSSFLTPAFIYRMGVKTSILCAWAGHMLFVLSNFFPHWISLLPGSLVLGLLSCPLWTSLEIYMTALARQEVVEHKKTSNFHASFSRLNGAFFSIFMGSRFTGNLVSSTILSQSRYNDTPDALGFLAESLQDDGDVLTTKPPQCGIHFCASSGQGKKLLATPDPEVVSALFAVFLVFEICGLAVTALYLPDLQQPSWTGSDVWRKLTSHVEMMTQPQMWLLVPFLISRMMNLAIQVGTFTQAYISCTLGIRMVGYVMATWGLATMCSSALLGWLARYTGRQALCVAALAGDAIIFGVLTQWEPSAQESGVLFGLAALMGLVEGVWAVQVNALIASLFPLRADSAFAVKGMWSSLSMALTFLMATFLCPLARIVIAIVIIVVAFFSYLTLEARHLR